MESSRKSRPTTKRATPPSGGSPSVAVREKGIAALVAEHARLRRFVASRLGDGAVADDVLQRGLPRALRRGSKLWRGESAVVWFYRVLRTAVADCPTPGSENGRGEHAALMAAAPSEGVGVPPEWENVIRACFNGLLPALKPRYAEAIRRVDLGGEAKRQVARDIGVSATTMDVLLHRARRALRKRLEIFCGSCSRERCLEHFGPPRGRRNARASA